MNTSDKLRQKNTMEAPPPTVSFTIVTRNRRDCLRAALDGVTAQTLDSWEMVVLDNASTDGTAEMVAREYPWAKVIRLHRNIGCQPGRNIAMANCTGTYIFNLDDDGVLSPDAAELAVAVFEKRPKVGLVAAAVRVPDDRTHLIAHHNECMGARYTSAFIGAAHALRRDLLPRCGYFPEYVRGYAEADLALRVLDTGFYLWFAPEVVMFHEVSLIGRDTQMHHCYFTWHQLETAVRLEPVAIALMDVVWKLGLGLIRSLRSRHLYGFVTGVLRFLYELPRILKERSPVSKQAALAFHYLHSRHTRELTVVESAKEEPTWRILSWRMGREKGAG